MKRTSWPLISKRRNPSGGISYMVDPGMVAGKRPRRFFKSRGEAETYADQLRAARKNEGDSAFCLPEGIRIEALKCHRRVSASGRTITEAVDFFLRHVAPAGGTKNLAAAIAELVASKEKAGKKLSYVNMLRWTLNAFAREFPARDISDISRQEIENWLDATPGSLVTRRNRIRDLSILFCFAVKRGYAGSNPVEQIERPTVTIKRPEIFSVEEAEALLRAAESENQLKLLGFVAIGLFAGLRTSELKKLRWENISSEHGVIDVSEEIAKTRQQRNVEITPCLQRWLDVCNCKSGPIVPQRFRWKLLALRQHAGIEKWPNNGLRHSFGSYHLAYHQNANSTALQMGHSTTEMLFKHYRNYLVRAADVERYWNLSPRARKKLILFKRSAA